MSVATGERVAIVLAMHGSPPHDFPPEDAVEFFRLHAQQPRFATAELRDRYAQLDRRMRLWTRTALNDPFWAASHELAAHLADETGLRVIVGFTEFAAPDLDSAFDEAAGIADRVVVATPMMTRGGEHSEIDIPRAIARARERHPDLAIRYAWPYDMSIVAQFLARHLARSLVLV